MSKKILFIEDEEEFATLVSAYLRKKGYVVTPASTGGKSWQQLQKSSYDLVILDLGLPDEDGLELCEKIREKKAIPILILTARDGVFDKVTGLDVGADDYLVKPVSLKELVVRIDRLMRRDLKGVFRSSIFHFDGIKFNSTSGTLTSKGNWVKLTKKEKAVLEYFLLRKGQVLTRMEIMDHVWGEDIDMFSNSVNMVVSSLRKKLRQLSEVKFINSVHGLGYKFEVQKNE